MTKNELDVSFWWRERKKKFERKTSRVFIFSEGVRAWSLRLRTEALKVTLGSHSNALMLMFNPQFVILSFIFMNMVEEPPKRWNKCLLLFLVKKLSICEEYSFSRINAFQIFCGDSISRIRVKFAKICPLKVLNLGLFS